MFGKDKRTALSQYPEIFDKKNKQNCCRDVKNKKKKILKTNKQ